MISLCINVLYYTLQLGLMVMYMYHGVRAK